MPRTVERLRVAILVAGILLIVILVGYFVFARWKERFLRRDLPRRLGLDIQQDSTGFTLSKSEHGKTLFTLHAARAVQLNNGGNSELHDVRIVLYGQGTSPRQDRISGEDFAYDPRTQLVSAKGEVLIDLQSLAANASPANTGREIHLRTQGLVFDQKTGHASTDQQVEFHLPQMAGTAVGADYYGDEGLIDLHSRVRIVTKVDGGPAVLNASRAVLDRSQWQAHLTAASLDTARRNVHAEDATVWLRPDGSADHMLAQGKVTMTGNDGTLLTAPHVTAVFDADSRAQQVHADGGVTMHQSAGAKSKSDRDGQAREAWLDLDSEGKPAALRMAGDVKLSEASVQADSRKQVPQESWQRSLQAGEARVGFRNGIAQTLVARGSPVFHQQEGNGSRQTRKSLRGDTITASLRDGKTLSGLQASGHTQLTQQTSTGETDISVGDTLTANFSPTPASSTPQIAQAIQQGHVRFERDLAAPAIAKPASQETTIAYADRAEYQGLGETVVLTGSPRVSDQSSGRASYDIAAQTITLNRVTGDALAVHDVKATLLNQPGSEPEHVVADRAVLVRSSQTVTFTGSPRLWQQGNSVQAPTLILSQQPAGLTATASEDGKQLVHTVLVDQRPEARKPHVPTRVTSRKLVYSDHDHRARFTTGVTLVNADGTIRAEQVDAFLKPSGQATEKSNAPNAMMSGSLDHLIATGNVVLTQPSRQATGEELVYTADDSKFVLTGTPGRPPRVEDRQQGTVTGEKLQFLSQEDRVDVIGGDHRTVTTTHLKK